MSRTRHENPNGRCAARSARRRPGPARAARPRAAVGARGGSAQGITGREGGRSRARTANRGFQRA